MFTWITVVLLQKIKLVKKRHISQISVSSTPSAISKMPNLKEDNSVQEEARFLKLHLDSNPSDIWLHTKMVRILEMLSNIQSSLENYKQDTGNKLDGLK